MKRGTIVLTRFPFTDLSSQKRRPALIISSSESLDGDVIVAFITSVIQNTNAITELLLLDDELDFSDSGLRKTSVIKLDKLATLNKSIFTGELGFLNERWMRAADEKLKAALGLR